MKEAPPRPTISWLRWCGLCLGIFVLLVALLIGGLALYGKLHPENRIRAESMAILTGLEGYRHNTGALPGGDQPNIFREIAGVGGPGKRVFIEWPADHTGPDGRFLDPWGHPYFIEFLGARIRVISLGRDGMLGGGDDIVGAER